MTSVCYVPLDWRGLGVSPATADTFLREARKVAGADGVRIETEDGGYIRAFYPAKIATQRPRCDIAISLSGCGSMAVAKRFRSEQPGMPVVYISGEQFDPERCVPGSVFVAKPYQHIDILSACLRLRGK